MIDINEGDVLYYKKYKSNPRTKDWWTGDTCNCSNTFTNISRPIHKRILFKVRNLRNGDERWWSEDHQCDGWLYIPRDDVYIHNWFYTISEWRDSQINTLND